MRRVKSFEEELLKADIYWAHETYQNKHHLVSEYEIAARYIEYRGKSSGGTYMISCNWWQGDMIDDIFDDINGIKRERNTQMG